MTRLASANQNEDSSASDQRLSTSVSDHVSKKDRDLLVNKLAMTMTMFRQRTAKSKDLWFAFASLFVVSLLQLLCLVL